MHDIPSRETVAATGRELRSDHMLLVSLPGVGVGVLGFQSSVEKALKAFPARKSEAIMLAHTIAQISRTHILLHHGLDYVDDGIGVVKRRRALNSQVRRER